MLRFPHHLILLLACGLATFAHTSRASAEDPYRLLICLHFSEDPLFTRLYTRQVERQVQDQLANYFGELAKVQVTTAHPLIKRLEGGDVRTLQLSPQEFAACEVPDKAFVFSIENQEGMYHLHWRQLDGLMQQVSPPQSQPTPDRQWVAKAVCMAVKDDFAPVVIVQPDPDKLGTGQVKLSYKSAAHRELVARWLKLNTILQPFYVLKQKDGSLARVPIANTVLRISKNDTAGTATFYSNSSSPWKPTPRLDHYEALKVNAQKGHVRIKVLNAATNGPLLEFFVRANTTGFMSITDSHQFTLPDRHGIVASLNPIENLAFVEIIQGGSSRLHVPVPITSPLVDLTLRVSVDEQAKEKSDWERRLRYLVQDVSILQTAIDNNVLDTNRMHDEKKYEEELRIIKSVLADVAQNRQSALGTKDAMEQEAQGLKIVGNALLKFVDGQLAQIATAEKNLDTKAKDLRKMLDTMAAADRAQVLKNAGDAAAAIGDYKEALDKYDLALAEQIDQPKLRSHVEKIRKILGMSSPELDQARSFIHERWSQTDVTDLSKQFPEVERSLSALEQAGDYLTAQRLMRINTEHIGLLTQVIEALAASATEADVAEATKYKEFQDKLAEFQDRVRVFVASAEAGMPPPAAANAPPPPKTTQAEEEEPPPKK